MSQKHTNQYDRFQSLVQAIGERHKAGDAEATRDLNRLDDAITKAIGIFKLCTEERINSVIRTVVSDTEPTLAHRLRQQSEIAERKAAAEAARKDVNALADKYGVEPVFSPNASSELIAAELAEEAVSSLMGGQNKQQEDTE